MSFEKYKDKGLSGLTNIGNTCFLNAIMQVISHTYELNNYLDLKTYKKHLNNKYDSALLIEWDELRSLLWKENCVVSPYKFVSTVHKLAELKGLDMFTGFNQNDLPEFLIFLIDCFHTALSREVKLTITGKVCNETDKMALTCFEHIKQIYEKDYSEIWKIFYGIHVSLLEKVSNGDKISTVPEPFFIINLPIPTAIENPTLIDCFNLYVEGEILDGDNCFTLDDTKEKIEVKKTIMFWSFPDILVIDIKRYETNNLINKYTNNNKFVSRKKQIMIDFPLENLNLSQYVLGYNKETYVYDLYGVCNHMGSANLGHYTSFVKNANNKWYHYNDNRVAEVTDVRQIISPNAYCFFYRKRK